MKKFILSLFYITIILILTAYIIDYTWKETYFSFNNRAKVNLKGITSDIVFFGSSRCENVVIPSIVDSISGITSFNMGWAASNPREIYAAVSIFIKNNETPKMILLQLDHEHSFLNEDNLAKVPLLKYHGKGIINDYFSEKTTMENSIPLFFSMFYRDFGWRELLKMCFRNSYSNNMSGYSPVLSNIKNIDAVKCEVISDFMFEKNIWIEKTLEICKNNNIPVIIFTSPYFKLCGAENFQLLERYELPYWNFSSVFDDPMLFADNNHVNHTGAIKFSEMIGLKIRQTIEK